MSAETTVNYGGVRIPRVRSKQTVFGTTEVIREGVDGNETDDDRFSASKEISFEPLSERAQKLARKVTSYALEHRSVHSSQIRKLDAMGVIHSIPGCAIALQGGTHTLRDIVEEGQEPVFLRFIQEGITWKLSAIDTRTTNGQVIERIGAQK